MSKVSEGKAEFVYEHLEPMVVAMTEGDVTRMFYATYAGGEEHVVMQFGGGATKHVNVTGDSLKAIVQDVMKAL